MNPEVFAVFELLWLLVLDPLTGVLAGLLMVAAFIDVKTNRIPNWVVLGGVVFGVLYNGCYPTYHGENGWILAVGGLLVGFLMLFPIYLAKAMGAGDVKLMAMVGVFLGPWNTVICALYVFVAGGILAMSYLFWTGKASRGLRNVGLLMSTNLLMAPTGRIDFTLSSARSSGKLPYGVAIAAGTIVFLISKQLGFVH